jgi:hypothetical protein
MEPLNYAKLTVFTVLLMIQVFWDVMLCHWVSVS